MVTSNIHPSCETEIKQILDLIVDQIVRTELCELTVKLDDHPSVNTDVDQKENKNNSDETKDSLENLGCSRRLACSLEKEKQPKLATPQIASGSQYSTYGMVSEVKNVFAKALELLPCNQNFRISAKDNSAILKLSSIVQESTNDSVENQTVPVGKGPDTVHFDSPIAVFNEYSGSPFLSSGSTLLLSDEEPEGFDENKKNLTFVQSVEVNSSRLDTENTKKEEKTIEEMGEDISELFNTQIHNSEFTVISDLSPVEPSLKTVIQTDDGQKIVVTAEIASDMVDKNGNSHQQIISDAEKSIIQTDYQQIITDAEKSIIQTDCRKNTEVSVESTSNTLSKNENYHKEIINDMGGVGATNFLPDQDEETSHVCTDIFNKDDIFHDTDVYSVAVYDSTVAVLANRNYNKITSFIPLQEIFHRAPYLQSGLNRSPDLFLESAPVISTEYSEIKSEIDKSSVSENALTLKITDTEEVTEYKSGAVIIHNDISFENRIDHALKKDQKMTEAESEGTAVENQHVSCISLNTLSEVQKEENNLVCTVMLNEGSKRTENIDESISRRKRKLFHTRQENECPDSKAIKFEDLKQFYPTSITFQQPAQLKVLACKALDNAEESVSWSKSIPGSSTNIFNGIRINQESQTNSGMHQTVLYQSTQNMEKIREPIDSVVLDGKLSANRTIETNPNNVNPKVSGDCCNDIREAHNINENKFVPSEDKAWIQNEHVNYPGFITATDHLSQTSQGSSLGFIFDENLNEAVTPCNSQASVRSINYIYDTQAVNDDKNNDNLLTEVAEYTAVMDEDGIAKERDMVINNSKADLELDISELDQYIDKSIDQIVPNDGIVRTDVGTCNSECESDAKIYACDMDMYDEKDIPLCKQIEKTGQPDVTSNSCFKWRYAPSCDLDSSTVSTSPDLDLEDEVVKIIPLKISRKPIRLGLSRKQSLSHLHKPKGSKTQ